MLTAFLDIGSPVNITSYEPKVQAAGNHGVQSTKCMWIDHLLHIRCISARLLVAGWEFLTKRKNISRLGLSRLWRLVVDGMLVTVNRGAINVQCLVLAV